MFLIASLAAKFVIDYRAVAAFRGDDLRYFRYCATSWMCDRIIKRAEPLGWELIKREDAGNRCEYIVFKANDDAAPLSQLLIKLHWSGFPIKPQPLQLDCEKPDA
ncbi:hypothetical protein [Sphingomonas sp. VDB2]|uniref:hypothetical protein n=1 Tax=Sphingomonas sp. VDB2 TaxID=3228751 RepID=UPI003A80DC3E